MTTTTRRSDQTLLTSTEFHGKKSSFRIKHDDERFFTKLLSKETSKSQPSFRVYYGDVSSAVPFTWETIPGTPKHRSHEGYDVPPLTPPPSYYTNAADDLMNRRCNKRRGSTSRSKLHHLLHALTNLGSVAADFHPNKKEVHAPPLSTSSLSSHSWSTSSSSSSDNYSKRRRIRFSSWGSSFDERAMVDHIHRSEEIIMGSSEDPNKQSCFGAKKVNAAKIHGGGYYSSVKKALLSVVVRRSSE